MRTRNALLNGLRPSELSGALRDLHGVPVSRTLGAGAFDHLQEVGDTLDSLRRTLKQLKRAVRQHAPGTDGFSRLSRDRDAIEELIERVDRLLEIK